VCQLVDLGSNLVYTEMKAKTKLSIDFTETISRRNFHSVQVNLIMCNATGYGVLEQGHKCTSPLFVSMNCLDVLELGKAVPLHAMEALGGEEV
jgi:hypothetical protein